MNIILKVTEEEVKTAEIVIPDLREWIEHALRNKIRQCLDRLVLEHTDYNPARLTPQQKIDRILPLNLPSRLERDMEELQRGSSKTTGG